MCDLRVCQKEYICVKGCVRECKFLFEKERMCVCVRGYVCVCKWRVNIKGGGCVRVCLREWGPRREGVCEKKGI